MTSIYQKPALFSLEVNNDNEDFENIINESSFRINVLPTNELLELFERSNFTQHGKATWSRHIRPETARDIARFFNEYSENFTPFTLFVSANKIKNVHHMLLGQYDDHGRETNVDFHTTQAYLDNSNGARHRTLSRVITDIGRFAPAFQTLYNPFATPVRTDYSVKVQSPDFRHGAGMINEISEGVKEEISPAIFQVYVKNETLWIKMFVSPQLTGKITEGVGRSFSEESEYRNLTETLRKKVNGPGENAYVNSNYHNRWDILPAINTLDAMLKDHWNLEKSKEAFDLMEKADGMYTAGYSPGKPAKAFITRGKNTGNVNLSIRAGSSKSISLQKVLNADENYPDTEFVVHPSLVDIVAMNKAEDFEEDDRLLSFQREAVGLHLSTKIGYLNASDPGLGKSMMQLSSMRKRAESIDNYRGIIVSEANVRSQWVEYAQTWFPEAHVISVTASSQRQARDLIGALSFEGPTIVVVSYALTVSALDEQSSRGEMMTQFGKMTSEEKMEFLDERAQEESTIGELLLDTHWHDICADEAVSIRNGSSQQAKAMWLLRENSDVAVALTGTPVNKNPDDMGNLLEWIRKDKRLFQGHKLSREYDAESLEGSSDMFNDLAPLVFRRERNEVAAELKEHGRIQNIPKMETPQSILLTPSPAEKALAHAAEKELKRVYLELVSALDAVEDENGSSEDLKEAKAQLQNAHGQWLGGTQLARMATSDPQSIMNSESVGASLLVGQGLVENALNDTPTKREAFLENAYKHIEKGQSILVFTDFASVANSLVEALEENGIRAAAFTGANRGTRDANRQAFQDGDLDVLVCTQAAERGLTLHRASAVYHYDLPWTIERLVQRMGRALRVGSENEKVEIYFMILEGTVEERVASQVLSQGTSASMILDASRGVDVSKTGLGSTMSGLMTSSKSLASRKGALEFGKALDLAE